MISDYKECKFLVNYVENFVPDLLTWKEFADLINIRPLLTPIERYKKNRQILAKNQGV